MKKYSFKINGNDYDVSVKNVDDNVADVEVNGSSYSVEFDRAIETTKTPKLVREQVVPSTDISPSQQKTSSPSAPKGAGFVKSPLPGTILNVHVAVGDMVRSGDKLITLEAMKMENPIHSPVDGKVTEIFVDAGDVVQNGDVLLVVQ